VLPLCVVLGGRSLAGGMLRRDSVTVVRALQAALLIAILAFSISTYPGVRTGLGFNVVLDGWLQGGGYVAAAALAMWKPIRDARQRGVWLYIGAGLAARALAFVLYFAVVRRQRPIPYPSVADAGWLAMCVLVLVALLALSRADFPRLSLTLILDGAVGAIAASAIAVALLRDTVTAGATSGGNIARLVTNLAYPLSDLTLLLVIIAMLMAHRWRPPPAVWALAVGVAGFAVNDSVFLYQVTEGTFRPGTPLSALSLIATGVIACAPWLPATHSTATTRDSVPGLLLPGAFALACLGLLLYATQRTVPLLSVLLAGLGVAVAITRTGLSFRVARSVAEHKREARTDELTRLANRRGFNEAFSEALAARPAGDRLALLILDLDNFKAVNDTLGHHHGDDLLVQVAARLHPALRSGDLLARIGGDEFAVLVEGAGSELAGHVAERLRATLRRPFLVATRELDVSVSIGIALYPDDAQNPVAMLQHADLAMYDAKQTRSGQTQYSAAHHLTGRQRVDEIDTLRRALAANEFVLHYQPQVSLATGSTLGVEALVRWQQPSGGLVPPAAFLPQIERGGLMRPLTRQVLSQAVRQAALWHQAGRTLTVSVNLSVTDLLDPSLPEQVAYLLESFALPGRHLELELTEDLFMADPARARKVLTALLKLDIALVVDDYGTGYSSLGYLRDLREIRGLKLDRSFITRLDTDDRAAAIVESTITLGHALGLKVVAEGVETEAVRDRLAELGCPVAQGYLFARPMPAAELPSDPIAMAQPAVPGDH
jgi:diguanylate cyclase (GGDEF)-like protein